MKRILFFLCFVVFPLWAKQIPLVAGIMTGNSLDAVDVVVSAFPENEPVRDLLFYSQAYPSQLRQDLLKLKKVVTAEDGNMDRVYQTFPQACEIIQTYTTAVIQATKTALQKAQEKGLGPVIAIGFHGQTCAHKPPSYCRSGEKAYTVQVGDAKRLAKETGLLVVFDFRTAFIQAGFEGAPLAPFHHQRLAESFRKHLPLLFINAGNTSNLTYLYEDQKGAIQSLGWDMGPCNHFPDLWVRKNTTLPFDVDGKRAAKGRLSIPVLRAYFYESVSNGAGKNFLLQQPAKSSDPQWYHLPLSASKARLSLNDHLKTACYFSGYVMIHGLSFLPARLSTPKAILTFGGGWRNPVLRLSVKELLANGPILREHQGLFELIRKRYQGIPLLPSQAFGIDDRAMEARIMADLALRRLQNEPILVSGARGQKTRILAGEIAWPLGENLTFQ